LRNIAITREISEMHAKFGPENHKTVAPTGLKNRLGIVLNIYREYVCENLELIPIFIYV
jgi:hypothetical protein